MVSNYFIRSFHLLDLAKWEEGWQSDGNFEQDKTRGERGVDRRRNQGTKLQRESAAILWRFQKLCRPRDVCGRAAGKSFEKCALGVPTPHPGPLPVEGRGR